MPGGEGRAGTMGIFVSKFIRRIAELLSLLSWLKDLRRRPTSRKKDKNILLQPIKEAEQPDSE